MPTVKFKTSADFRALAVDPSTAPSSADVLAERNAAYARADYLFRSAEGKPFNADDQREYDQVCNIINDLDAYLPTFEVDRSELAGIVNRGGGSRAARPGDVLDRDQTVTAYAQGRGLVNEDNAGLSMQKWIRGVVTGDWDGAQREFQNAMVEGTGSAGGFLVPTPLSTSIIDRARNQSRLIQAGAVTVPMESSTLKLARVASDPSAAWHTESAVISPSDPTLEVVTFTARSLAGIVKLSRELVEDADNVDQTIIDIFGEVFASRIDQAGLYGSGVAPEPQGVKGATGVTTLSLGANGVTPTSWDFLVDAKGTLADNNFTPTGIIDAPRTERTLAKLKDTTLQPLRMPDYIADVPRFETNQVPINLTQGSASNASDVFTADWTNLMLGIRHRFSVQVLQERYADTGEIGLLCYFRGDFQLARPKAFVVSTGVLP